MAIPEQGDIDDEDIPEGTYSASEMRHIVARKVMRYRMHDFEARVVNVERELPALISKLEAHNNIQFNKLEAAIASLQHTLGRGTDDLRQCRKELERDIEAHYASKENLEVLRAEINTEMERIRGDIRTNMARIGAGILVGMFCIDLAFKYFG